MDELKERCARFLSELGIATTKFCDRVQVSTSAYYAWKAGTLKLSEDTLNRIDSYLKQYNF